MAARKPNTTRSRAVTSNPEVGFSRREPLGPRLKGYDGLWRAAFRYPSFNVDELTQQQGYKLADKMMTMGACRAPFNLKRYAVQSEGWEIVPATTDPKDPRSGPAAEYADFSRWLLNNIVSPYGGRQDMTTVLFEMTRGMWEGFRVADIVPRYLEEGPYAGKIGFRNLSFKHCKQIGMDIDPDTSEVMYVTSYAPGSSYGTGDVRLPYTGAVGTPGGYDFTVPVERCLIYTYNPNAGLMNSFGDWRGCAKHYNRLDANMRFWALALERWGAPVLIATASTSNTQQLQEAQQLLDQIRDGASAVVPKGLEYQIATCAATMFEAFQKSNDWDCQQIVTNILGNTLSTGTTGGTNTNALGEVHQDTEKTVDDYARRTIENEFTSQVILRNLVYNFADFAPALCPRLSLGGDEETDTLNLMKTFDLAIKDGVIWSKAKVIRERLGLPPMDDAEEAGIAAEKQAEQEAQQQLADSRNSGKTAAMSDYEARKAVKRLAFAIGARNHLAKFEGGWVTINGHPVLLDGDGESAMAPEEADPTASAKSILAKNSAHRVDKDIQRYSEEHNEPKLAKSIGGVSLRDNEPVDVIVIKDGIVAHGVELKTMVSNKAGKITMKADAMQRKGDWVAKNHAPYHTIVYDDHAVYNADGEGKHGSESNRTIYYKRGYGSFRVSSMHIAKDAAELTTLMETADDKLPAAARPPATYPGVKPRKAA